MSASASTLSGLLAARAATEPGHPAILTEGGTVLRMSTWDDRANAAANDLIARGVRPGQQVGLLFDGLDWVDFAICYIGVQRAGAAAVPLSTSHTPATLGAILVDCAAVGLIHGSAASLSDVECWTVSAAELHGPAAPPGVTLSPDALAQILYTSGTTGTPKGVSATHANLAYGHEVTPRRRAFGHSSHFVHAFPIGTNAAQMMLVNALVAAPTGVVAANFDADRFAALVARYRAGTVFLVPAMAVELLNSGALDRHDLSCVRLLSSSAAALPAPIAAGLLAAFPEATLVNNYTSTEAMPAQTTMIVDSARPGSVGRPTASQDLRITGEDDRPMPTGEIGEVWLRAPTAQRAYHGDPAATARAFPPGWTRMGDFGYLDQEGYLFLVDREADMIKSGAMRISSQGVEAVLYGHPAVRDAAVVAVPHPTMGAMVAAAVVLRGDVSDVELRAYARRHLPQHEVPTRILVVDALPRNDLGKVVKPEVRTMFATPAVVEPTAGTRAVSGSEQRLAALWTRVLGVPEPAPDADFFALGGDSLRAAQLASLAEEAWGVTVPAALVFDRATLADQAAWLDIALPTSDPATSQREPETQRESEAQWESQAPGRTGRLGAAQEYWWRWLCETMPRRNVPSIPTALRINDQVDPTALQSAIDELVRRHDALRTRYSEVDGVPVATISDDIRSGLRQFDATGATPAARVAAAGEHMAAEAGYLYDLERDPPLRACLVRLDDEDFVLGLTVHHLTFDGASIRSMLHELGLLYSGLRSGRPTLLPDAMGQAQHVAWDRSQWMEASRYWDRQLDGAPTSLASLPGRHRNVTRCALAFVHQTFPEQTTRLLREAAARHQMSLPMAFAAGWAATLAAWSDTPELVLAHPVSGRTRPAYEMSIGCLFRWVLMRLDLRDDPTLETLLPRARDVVLGAAEHQYHEYDRYRRQIRYPAYFRFESWGRPVHFPGLLSEPFEIPARPDLEWDLAEGEGEADRLPPEILVTEEPDGDLKMMLVFNRIAYDPDDVAALGSRFQNTLAGALARPDAPLSTVNVVASAAG